MIKRILIVCAVLLLTVLVGIAAVFYYVNYIYIPRNLKPMVTDALRSALHRPVTITDASYVPFRGFTFEGISITNPDGTDFCSIQHLEAQLSKLPRMMADTVSGSGIIVVEGVSFSHRRIRVRGGCRMEIAGSGGKRTKPEFTARIVLQDIAVQGIGPLAEIAQANGVLVCTQESFSSEGMQALIGNQTLAVELNGVYAAERVTVNRASLSYGMTALDATAVFSGPQGPRLDMAELSGVIDAADCRRLIPEVSLPVLTGQYRVHATCSGPLASPQQIEMQAELTSEAAEIGRVQFTALRMHPHLQAGTLTVPDCTLNCYGGAVQAQATLQVFEPMLPMSATVEARQLAVHPLSESLTGYSIGNGMLDAQIAVQGPVRERNALQGNGWFKITDAGLSVPLRFRKKDFFYGSELALVQFQAASASFTLAQGIVRTEDFVLDSKDVNIACSGTMNFDTVVDARVTFTVGGELIDSIVGAGDANIIRAVSRQLRFVNSISGPLNQPARLRWGVLEVPGQNLAQQAITVIRDSGSSTLEAGKQILRELATPGPDAASGETDTDQRREQLKQKFEELKERLLQ